ncbi:DUF3037 domain-containing protein [Ohtaekwangia sp.]|uniref:DUF3037 domain-containing protein n=1 Tax=Ohtaekwangia sp. TaxID=2066019 RepID=UPI002F91DBBA
MPESLLFEYAVIRIVPKVEREEFINIGVILYCSAQKFLQTRFNVNEERLRALCKKTDLEELQGYISSFERICRGGADGGPIGKLSMAERFRWLTATRSTVLQTSKVHPGLCENAEDMLNHLFTQLVL